jgi:hypothetical protein
MLTRDKIRVHLRCDITSNRNTFTVRRNWTELCRTLGPTEIIYPYPSILQDVGARWVAAVAGEWSRSYFMTFYLVTMVLMTKLVAFILDTFLFRIQYKRAMDRKTEEKLLRTKVRLAGEEIDFCYRHFAEYPAIRTELLAHYEEDLALRGSVAYVGFRPRTKEINTVQEKV